MEILNNKFIKIQKDDDLFHVVNIDKIKTIDNRFLGSDRKEQFFINLENYFVEISYHDYHQLESFLRGHKE